MSAPILQARAVYGQQRDFEHDLLAHCVHGIVVSTPSIFLMGRPVYHNAAPRLLENIRFQFPCDQTDCWLVWSAAGPLAALLALMPYELRYVAFHRRKDPELRVYPTARLRALAECQRPHRSSIGYHPSSL